LNPELRPVSKTEELRHELQELSSAERIAFGASCCERAFRNYEFFSRTAKWGDPRPLREAIDTAWSVAEGRKQSASGILNLMGDCERVTPDLDDFSAEKIDVAAAAGQEATFMVRLLLELCLKEDAERIARFARDTLDMLVQVTDGLDPSDVDLEQKIAESKLMRDEIEIQRTEVVCLREANTAEEIREFRKKASSRQSRTPLVHLVTAK